MSIATGTIADRFIPRTAVNSVVLVFAGALVTALAAQIQIPMWPVPLTLQTFAVLLVGATLGAGRGAASLATYLAMGAAGLPVLASRGFTNTVIKVGFSFALGSLVIYAFGVAGLMLTLGLTLSQAVAAGVVPFLIGDAVKAVAAAALLPAAWKLVRN